MDLQKKREQAAARKEFGNVKAVERATLVMVFLFFFAAVVYTLALWLPMWYQTKEREEVSDYGIFEQCVTGSACRWWDYDAGLTFTHTNGEVTTCVNLSPAS